jgi:hypothetical protein
MDNFNEDDMDSVDGEEVLLINDLDNFIKETYKFAVMNLDATLHPAVSLAPDEDKSKIKEDILMNMDKGDIDDDIFDEIKDIYSLEKATEEINKIIIEGDDGEKFIRTYELSKVVEIISKNMMFGLFDKMHKNGLIDLVWDSQRGDFAYTVNKKETVDETKVINEFKNKKKRKKK